MRGSAGSCNVDLRPKRVALLMASTYVSDRLYCRRYWTPNGDNVWEGCEFVLNPMTGVFDGIVVLQSCRSLDHEFRLTCRKGCTLLAVVEPPDILRLPRGYCAQFGLTLTQDPRLRLRNVILSQPGLSWFVEVPIREALSNATPSKDRLISAITSTKTDTVGHRRRLRFVRAMKDEFGDDFDWFGRGVRETSTKAEGLLGYKYHMVLENGQWPHYWTEKLADAFVANSFPLYWGAPNVSEYFPSDSYLPIDIRDVEGTIRRIREAIADERFEKSQAALAEARRRVLLEYHPYETYLRWLNQLPQGEYVETRIRPQSDFDFSRRERWEIRIHRWWDRLTARAE
jgi:hypothetical protein